MSNQITAVAPHVIELSIRGEYFTVEDIRCGIEDAPDRKNVNRVLEYLEADDWIEQREDGWEPSVKAKELGDFQGSPVGDSSEKFDLGVDGVLDSETSS